MTDRERIRTLFLRHRKEYTPTDVARLTRYDAVFLVRQLETGEIEGRVEYRIPHHEVMHLALERWPLETIFEALGKDAEGVIPPLLRIEKVQLKVPAYIVRFLELMAGEESTTVNELLRKMLADYVDGSLTENRSAAIPGLIEAAYFPELPVPSPWRP